MELAALRRRVDAYESVLAIQELKARYGDLVDQRFTHGRVVDDDRLAEVAEAVAALFTEDAVRVTPRGTFTGRAAIEKSFADGDYQFYHSTDLFINVDRVIADGNEVRSIGKWSCDIKEPGRLPEHVGGRYSMLWVHDGDTWKIHENTYDDSGRN